MITIQNTTRGDLSISPGVLIPALGARDVDRGQFVNAMKTDPVQAWFNAGKLIAGGAVTMREAVEPSEDDDPSVFDRLNFNEPVDPVTAALAAAAAPAERVTKAVEATEEIGSADDIHRDKMAALLADAAGHGIRVASNWKPETIERKIAEAEAAAATEV